MLDNEESEKKKQNKVFRAEKVFCMTRPQENIFSSMHLKSDTSLYHLQCCDFKESF